MTFVLDSSLLKSSTLMTMFHQFVTISVCQECSSGDVHNQIMSSTKSFLVSIQADTSSDPDEVTEMALTLV